MAEALAGRLGSRAVRAARLVGRVVTPSGRPASGSSWTPEAASGDPAGRSALDEGRSVRRSAADSPARSSSPILPVAEEAKPPAVSSSEPAGSAETARPDRPATAEDIRLCFALLHGRRADEAVVAERRGQPLKGVLEGALDSEEFRSEVLQPVLEGRLPRARLHLPPPAALQGSTFIRDLAMDGSGAPTPLELLRRLHASPVVQEVLARCYAPDLLQEVSGELERLAQTMARQQRDPLRPRGSAPLVVRAAALRLQDVLAHALGPAHVSPDLLVRVARACWQVQRSAAPLTGLLGPVPLGRWLLDRPDDQLIDFARWPAQLRVVADLCFAEAGALERRPAEMRAVDQLREGSVRLELAKAGPGRPGYTLAMACLALMRHGHVRLPRDGAEADAAVQDFLDDVARHPAFERRLTPAQRRALGERAVGGVAAVTALAGCTGPAMAAEQIAVDIQPDGTGRLRAPTFVASPSGHEAADDRARLKQLLEQGAAGDPMDQVAFASSALSWAAGRPEREPRLPTEVSGRGRKPLPLARQLGFNEIGEGRRHLLAGGWWQGEATHSWSRQPTALLAFHLAQDTPVDGLDLLMRFMAGPQVEGVLEVLWNGALVGRLRPRPERVQSARVHLGDRHRRGLTPNILALRVDALFEPPGDARRLGVALCDLTFLPR